MSDANVCAVSPQDADKFCEELYGAPCNDYSAWRARESLKRKKGIKAPKRKARAGEEIAIRSLRWERFDYAAGYFQSVKRLGGVYAFYCDGQLLYIGQSGDALKRISSYKIRFSYGNSIITPWGNFRRVEVKVSYGRRHGDWAMRELRLIRRLRPPQNCIGSIRQRTMKEAPGGW